MASYSITTTTTSYTAEEERAARQQVGPNGSAEAFGKKLQENRAASQASAAQKQQASSVDQLHTEAKLRVAAKADPTVKSSNPEEQQSTKAAWHLKLLGSFNNAANSTGDAFQNLDRYALNFTKQLYNSSNSIQGAIEGATSGIAGSIDNLTTGIGEFEQEALTNIAGWGAGIKKALEPVGLCSAVGDLTDLAKNPLGAPQFLANSLTSLVGKINPGFVEQMDNTYKSLNLEGLSNLPSKMMGSIRNLATAADAILSVPFEIMSDVYNGLMEILEAIADLIDGIVTMVMNLAMAAVNALVDKALGGTELLEFFSAIGDLASFVGDIAGMVGGFDAVTNITGQVGDFASIASGTINNPLGAAMQFIPGAGDVVSQGLDAVGQITGALRNPEQFLPPEIGQQMQKISQIPGLGFVGNLGYSVGDTLDTLSDGVFSVALGKYADKLPILNDAFNKPQDAPPAVDTQENHPDTYEQGILHSTAQGIPQLTDTGSYKIFEEGPSSRNRGSISAYNMTQNQRMPVEGDVREVSAYGVSERQVYRNGRWVPVTTGTVTAYGITSSTNR